MPIVTATTLYNNIFYNINNNATIPKIKTHILKNFTTGK